MNEVNNYVHVIYMNVLLKQVQSHILLLSVYTTQTINNYFYMTKVYHFMFIYLLAQSHVSLHSPLSTVYKVDLPDPHRLKIVMCNNCEFVVA